jgi:hypothetical protein
MVRQLRDLYGESLLHLAQLLLVLGTANTYHTRIDIHICIK